MNAFNRHPQATDQEKAMLRAVPDNEVFQQMIGNVKVMTTGMTVSKKGGKGGKPGRRRRGRGGKRK